MGRVCRLEQDPGGPSTSQHADGKELVWLVHAVWSEAVSGFEATPGPWLGVCPTFILLGLRPVGLSDEHKVQQRAEESPVWGGHGEDLEDVTEYMV